MRSPIVRLTAVAVIILTFSHIAFACDCFPEYVFCRSIEEDQNIARVVVKDFPSHNFMEIEILDNIHNEIAENEILVFGNDGASCTQLFFRFELQDTLILALTNLSRGDGNDRWFLQGICVLNYLKYENGNVLGQITDSRTSIPFEEFSSKIMSCIDDSVIDVDVNEKVKIYPNPFIDELQVELNRLKNYHISVVDVNGKQVHQERVSNSNLIRIRSENWQKGTYFIIVKHGNTEIIEKVCKM